jgi:hypothetical protein
MLLTALAFYDKAVHLITVYNVNLDILYFGSWHLFAICTCLIFASYRRMRLEKVIFYLCAFVFLINFMQNIIMLNHDYIEFKSFINNAYIDTLKWFFFIASLITFLWINIKYRLES